VSHKYLIIAYTIVAILHVGYAVRVAQALRKLRG
jgi:hypothetical protein